MQTHLRKEACQLQSPGASQAQAQGTANAKNLARLAVPCQVLFIAYIIKSVRWTFSYCVPCVMQRENLLFKILKVLGVGHRRDVSENRKNFSYATISKPSFPLLPLSPMISFFPLSFPIKTFNSGIHKIRREGEKKNPHFKRKIHFEHLSFTKSRAKGKGKHFPPLPPSPLFPPSLLCFKPKQTYSLKGHVANTVGFVGHLASVTNTSLHQRSTNLARDQTLTIRHWLCFNKTLWMNP